MLARRLVLLSRPRTGNFSTSCARYNMRPPPPPPPQASKHSLFYADLATLAPVFMLASATYLGLKVLRETFVLQKLEAENKDKLGVLESELDDLVKSKIESK